MKVRADPIWSFIRLFHVQCCDENLCLHPRRNLPLSPVDHARIKYVCLFVWPWRHQESYLKEEFLDRWGQILAQTSERVISEWTTFTGTFINMFRVMISTAKEPLTLRNSHTRVSRWELSSDYSAKRERYKYANIQRSTSSFEFSSTDLALWSVLSLRNQLRNDAKMRFGTREIDLLGFSSSKHSAKAFRNILSRHKLHPWWFWRTTSRHHWHKHWWSPWDNSVTPALATNTMTPWTHYTFP